MKKIAIIIDFDPKINYQISTSMYDVFIIDRYHDSIGDIETNADIKFAEEMTMDTFYKHLRKAYKEIICLFISYQYTDVYDHELAMKLNKERNKEEAKIIPYLINYKNQNKRKILLNTLEMIDKGFEVKDILIRIHQIRELETFSLNDIIMRYTTCLL